MRVVSKRLRESARGQDCTLRWPGACNFDPSTTVLAHLESGHKGMGMKGPDNVAAFMCSGCHALYDSHHRLDIPASDVLRALTETQLIWIESGMLTVKGKA